MKNIERLSHGFRDQLDNLTEGWQHLWQKTRDSITHFVPLSNKESSPVAHKSARWGVLSSEVYESNNDIEIQLEAPGMEAKNFQLSVDHQVLRVKGEKHFSEDRKEGTFHITERAYGSFERWIPLPAEVDEDKVKAKYQSGVLVVTLPKLKSSGLRRITVE